MSSRNRKREDLFLDLQRAQSGAACEVIGADSLTNRGEIIAVTAVLRAFAKDPTGFVFCQPTLASGAATRMPDIVIAFPTVGLICIEVKGVDLAQVARVAAGHVWVEYDGRVKEESVAGQAEKAMYKIQKAIRREAGGDKLFVDWLSMFPTISRADWTAGGFDARIFEHQCLAADQMQKATELRKTLETRAQSSPGWSKRVPTEESLKAARRAFGDSYVLQEEQRGSVQRFDSIGALILARRGQDRRLSHEQQELARQSFDWRPQLIRGVAGSGKTKVLALNLAHYLDRRAKERQSDLFPGDLGGIRVGAVCFNQALVPTIRQDVEVSFAHLKHARLDGEDLFIGHFNGLMYRLSKRKGGPLDYIHIPKREGDGDNDRRARDYLRQIDALGENVFEPYRFDTLYVDEAQDFSPAEFDLLVRLCRIRPGSSEPNIVLFYDDAQNVYGRPRPTWADHGINVSGGRSTVMTECYRNSAEVVTFAFNVLLGAGASADVRVRTRTFADLNSLRKRTLGGLPLVEERQGRWHVNFARRTEPEHRPSVRVFDDEESELEWVRAEVRRLVEGEQVAPEDMLILAPKRKDCDLLKKSLEGSSDAVRSILLPHTFSPSEKSSRRITRNQCLTITTIKTAKGHEGYIVFLPLTHRYVADDILARASFYVGCTRAKVRLYVSGVNDGGEALIGECDRVSRLLRGSK